MFPHLHTGHPDDPMMSSPVWSRQWRQMPRTALMRFRAWQVSLLWCAVTPWPCIRAFHGGLFSAFGLRCQEVSSHPIKVRTVSMSHASASWLLHKCCSLQYSCLQASVVQLLRPHMKGTAMANVILARRSGAVNVQMCPVAVLSQLRAATHTTLVDIYDQLAQMMDEVRTCPVRQRPCMHVASSRLHCTCLCHLLSLPAG
jgi:hypothetical protein